MSNPLKSNFISKQRITLATIKSYGKIMNEVTKSRNRKKNKRKQHTKTQQ